MTDTLALDWWRCHNRTCQARHDCKRWCDRKKYGPQTPHMQGERCDMRDFVPIDEAAALRWEA
jgi:hypothetical protein